MQLEPMPERSVSRGEQRDACASVQEARSLHTTNSSKPDTANPRSRIPNTAAKSPRAIQIASLAPIKHPHDKGGLASRGRTCSPGPAPKGARACRIGGSSIGRRTVIQITAPESSPRALGPCARPPRRARAAQAPGSKLTQASCMPRRSLAGPSNPSGLRNAVLRFGGMKWQCRG